MKMLKCNYHEGPLKEGACDDEIVEVLHFGNDNEHQIRMCQKHYCDFLEFKEIIKNSNSSKLIQVIDEYIKYRKSIH